VEFQQAIVSFTDPDDIKEWFKGPPANLPSDFVDTWDNAILMIKLLNGGDGPRRDVVLMNSAAAIIVGGKAKSFEEGAEIAKESIDSGRAYDVLRELIRATEGDPSKLESLEEKL